LFLQVDIVRPQVAHFIFRRRFGLGEGGYEDLSVISIDLSTKTVESDSVYGPSRSRSGGFCLCPTHTLSFLVVRPSLVPW
jgi:hypothetical protein